MEASRPGWGFSGLPTLDQLVPAHGSIGFGSSRTSRAASIGTSANTRQAVPATHIRSCRPIVASHSADKSTGRSLRMVLGTRISAVRGRRSLQVDFLVPD